jgi:hypothetical protein
MFRLLEIFFKIENKQMINICFLNSGNIVTPPVMYYVANYNFCKVYSILIIFSKFELRFILVTL